MSTGAFKHFPGKLYKNEVKGFHRAQVMIQTFLEKLDDNNSHE